MGNWDLVWRQYHVFSFWENPSPQELSCLLEDSECFLMLSLIVILRSGCITSLTVLNYNLKDHLTKVYDCVVFNRFLDKEASSLMGRLYYQLILNLRFKGRGTNFFKINIFM